MIQKLLDEAVKPFEALLTKQRCIVFLLCCFFMSPQFFDCLLALGDDSSVSVFLGTVGDAFAAVGVVDFGLLLIWVFYLSPRAIYWGFFFLNRMELRKQQRAVDALLAFSMRESDYYVDNYFEIVSVWKEDKESAEKEMRFRLEYLELISAFSALCVLYSVSSSYGLIYSVFTLPLVFLYALQSASKNTAGYLTSIAPYKLAMSKLRSIES